MFVLMSMLMSRTSLDFIVLSLFYLLLVVICPSEDPPLCQSGILDLQLFSCDTPNNFGYFCSPKLAGAFNRIDKIFFCAHQQHTCQTCKSRTQIGHPFVSIRVKYNFACLGYQLSISYMSVFYRTCSLV